MSELTLAKINKLIDQYINKSASSNDQRKKFLSILQNRIQAIYTALKGWPKFGLIDNAITSNTLFTQTALINETNTMQEKMIGFLWLNVTHLNKDVAQEKKNETQLEYHQLLVKIERCLQATINHLSKHVRIKKSNISLDNEIDYIINENGEKFFNELYMLELFDARYMPFYQSTDPVRGQVEIIPGMYQETQGHCLGYVKSWCKTISKQGFFSHRLLLDPEVYALHKAQHSTFTTPVCAKYYRSTTDFRELINEMLPFIKPDKTYEFIFPYTNHLGYIQHDIGIRFIATTQEYEICDPNIGIIVFNNKKNFIDCFAFILVKVYFDILTKCKPLDCQIHLYENGAQPAHTQPSIPPVYLLQSIP